MDILNIMNSVQEVGRKARESLNDILMPHHKSRPVPLRLLSSIFSFYAAASAICVK
jgi:hypothetical protein